LRAVFQICPDPAKYDAIYIDIYNLRELRCRDPMTNFYFKFKFRVATLVNDYFEKLMNDHILLGMGREFNLAEISAHVDNIRRLEDTHTTA
jgi:hypothetical protein